MSAEATYVFSALANFFAFVNLLKYLMTLRCSTVDSDLSLVEFHAPASDDSNQGGEVQYRVCTLTDSDLGSME